jgi:hypothetical protein
VAGQLHLEVQAELSRYPGCIGESQAMQPVAWAWAGAIVHILAGLGVCVLISVEKWNKMKGILNKWRIQISEGDPKLLHKELLSDRGFLVYVTRTYPAMICVSVQSRSD